jgi:lysophospholipase L1-like esterase
VKLARPLAVLVTAALMVACSSEPPAPTTPREHRIAIIGDSFTEGSDEGGLDLHSWPELMRENLNEMGLVVELDVSAEGSAGYAQPGLNQSFFSDKANIIDDRDDLVIFFGGANDTGVDPVGLKTAVHNTFAKAKNLAPHAKFIVIGPAVPNDNPPASFITVRDVIREQANEAGMQFVDPIDERWLVGDPDLIGADGFHPTDRGHVYLEQKIQPLVRTVYGGQ